MNGITYFRKKTPYPGDVTKNCSLTSVEMDDNFYTLEGRDIESVEPVDDGFVITLYNGKTFLIDKLTEGCVRDVTASFDKDNGILTLVVDGKPTVIEGFTVEYYGLDYAATDGTLLGEATVANPIGINPVYQTGHYKPVNAIIDMTKNGALPLTQGLPVGYRAVTIENISTYGLLYNYHAVKEIASELEAVHSAWRVPTKEDWDNMLNGVEPLVYHKNHTDGAGNKYLGKDAGMLLKSVDKWRVKDPVTNEHHDGHPHLHDTHCDDALHDEYCHNDSLCDKPFYGHGHKGHEHQPYVETTGGIDKYGLRIVPAGAADDTKNFNGFGERGWYWTSSKVGDRSVYIKRFDYDHTCVYQDIIPDTYYVSLRLVKDYNGSNFNAKEVIMGETYPTALIPTNNGKHLICTAVNFAVKRHIHDAIDPNNGFNLTVDKRYFINEWDGCKWLRAELMEGESVVVKNKHDNDNVEYRLINNTLENVAEPIYRDVMNEVNVILHDMAAHIDEVETKSKEKDEELENKINDVETSLNDTITTLNDFIDTTNTEISGLKDTDEQLRNDITEINDQIDEIKQNHATLVDNVATLEATHVSDMKAVSDRIDGVVEDVKTVDGQLLVQDGSSYNEENGQLTLKSKDEKHDVTVQFSFNFGTI